MNIICFLFYLSLNPISTFSSPTSIPITNSAVAPSFKSTFIPNSSPTSTVNDNYNLISTYAGTGEGGYFGDNGIATKTQFNYPTGLTTDSIGNLYIADSGNYIIRKVNRATNIITTIAGIAGSYGYNGDNIQAINSLLNYPNDVFVDSIGDFYIADTYNCLIRTVNVATGIITSIVGNRNYGFSGDNGPATSASIGYIHGLALDRHANFLYFSDYCGSSSQIRKVNLLTNIITTFFAERSIYLYGLSFDASGNYLYFSSYYFIKKINMVTNIVITVAGSGDFNNFNDNIAATSASVNAYDVTIDGFGNIFFTDYDNQRIRKIDHNTGFYD
jgi:hypothetical protein